jgi:hypothetical protein
VFTDYTYQDSGVQDLSDHYPLWGKFNLKICKESFKINEQGNC